MPDGFQEAGACFMAQVTAELFVVARAAEQTAVVIGIHAVNLDQLGIVVMSNGEPSWLCTSWQEVHSTV